MSSKHYDKGTILESDPLSETGRVTPSVLHRALRVMHLIAPVESLFEPTLLRDVVHFTLMHRLRPASVQAFLSS
jgi:hypothetical protein